MSTEELISQGVKLCEEKKYPEAIDKLNEALESIINIQEQIDAQFWLGRCYFEQAIKTSNKETATLLFDNTIEHHTKELELAKQLTDKQKIIEIQNNALSILYISHFKKSEKQKDFSEYFNYKKTHIETELSKKLTSSLKSEICSILSVLQITPIELGKTPLAHYTNAHVNDILFGLAKQEDSDKNKFYHHMRMTSATYMNDPTEGKSLFELLGHPEVTLDNILELSRKNAFFTCLSSRVNDLNQFRLYGKENSIEASGCCLVFNKNKQWLKQPNTVSSFFSKNDEIQEIENPIESNHENLPLYQIAYIAYVDQYINTKNCLKITKKFHVLLNHTIKNSQLNKMRENILSESLKDLESKLCNKKDLSLDEKQDLEYIRYLFKDFAFRDEEEFRLLKIAEIGKETECCDKTNSVFVPYADISNMVDEVILGTNYEKTNQKRKVEVFRHKMKEHFPDVKIRHSRQNGC